MKMLNQKKINKMMKQMGMKMEEIDASEVVIKTADKNLVIKNPEVSKVNMMGRETFQVVGEVTEKADEEDIKTIMEQTGCGKEKAEKALENEKDLAKAILKIKGK